MAQYPKPNPTARRAPIPARLAGISLAFVLLAAACGPDDNDDSSGSDPGPDNAGTLAADLPEEVAAAAAEAKELGLEFVTSREELEARAREEGGFDIYWALMPNDYADEYLASFTQQWPHLDGKISAHALDGPEARQRLLLEAGSGALDDSTFGVAYLANEVYTEMEEYCDWDVYGMAEAGILDIPLEMIDPVNRTVIAAGNSASVFVYNIDAFEDADVPLPETWDDIIEHPEIYGPDGPIDIEGDVRLATFSALVPAWGLDRAAEWYKRFAEDIQPIWSSRFIIEQFNSGERDAQPFVNLHNSWDLMQGRPERLEVPLTTGDSMGILFLEPVPVRITDTHCVFNDDINPSPYSSLLFLEWLAGPDGQRSYEDPRSIPYQSSLYSEIEGGLGDLLEGMELSVIQWDDLLEQAKWIEEIFKGAGFPQVSS